MKEIDNLYTIKGERGLFHMTGFADKVGLARMFNIDTETEKMYPRQMTTRLGDFSIATVKFDAAGEVEEGKIGVSVVFKALYEYSKTRELPDPRKKDFGREDDILLMGEIIPDYDIHHFKIYHFRKILQWYLDSGISEIFKAEEAHADRLAKKEAEKTQESELKKETVETI